MRIDHINNVFFVGVGGIGMSALARYFNALGKQVGGYDKTKTPLSSQLQAEGIDIMYTDEVELLSQDFLKSQFTMIVMTPAVPASNTILNYFIRNKYKIYKRSEVLGFISREMQSYCIAGTHGKTSISTMLAYLLNETEGCNAFLGGLSVNYNTNLILNQKSHNVIIEADEYDRSFLNLRPNAALITAVDEDHLDIYGNKENIYQAFNDFIQLIKHEGALIIHKDLENSGKLVLDRPYYTYSFTDTNADFFARNIEHKNGLYTFDFNCPKHKIKEIQLAVPGKLNAENFVGATALACMAGADDDEIRIAAGKYKGVKRRFELQYNAQGKVYIDDYAHHPVEICKTLDTIKDIWPDKRVTVVFQPHLYSRTKDLYKEFAEALDVADKVYLLDIYPAREEAIAGVTSHLIKKALKKAEGMVVSKTKVLEELAQNIPDILLTMGAGDIDTLIDIIKAEVYHA